eukprot:507948-Rhodomonas_salina.3
MKATYGATRRGSTGLPQELRVLSRSVFQGCAQQRTEEVRGYVWICTHSQGRKRPTAIGVRGVSSYALRG